MKMVKVEPISCSAVLVCCSGLILFLSAPLLVHVGFWVMPSTVQWLCYRVFSLWIPLIALSTVLIFQLLLPISWTINSTPWSLWGGLSFGSALLLAPSLPGCRNRVVSRRGPALYLGSLLHRVSASRIKSLCPFSQGACANFVLVKA